MSVLAGRAGAWRRQWLWRSAAEAAARLFGVGALGLAAALWLDRLAAPPQAARWALWIAGSAASVFAVYWWGARPLARFDWGEVFDAAARRFPETREVLKPAWELSRGPAGPGTSEQLRLAHVARVERALQGLPDAAVFSARPSPAAARLACVGAAALVALLPLRGSPSWERVLRPWGDVPLERYVRVDPGDARLARGEPARIAARWDASSPVAGRPGDLKLWVRGPQGWLRASWDSGEDGSAAYTVEALTSPLDYRLGWRGLESRVYRLTPVTAPELDDLRVTVRGPQARTEALSGAAPVSALRGAWLTVSGLPNQALAQAQARLSSWPVPLPMKAGPDGRLAASFPLREDASLTFDLRTADGRGDPHPVVYQLKALADQPPQIQLLSPVEPMVASPQDHIPVTYSAQDDGGLTSVSLVLTPAAGRAREIVVERPGGRRELAGETLLDLSQVPLGRLTFQLKALDNASPPQAGYSAKGVIDVSDLEGAHEQTAAQWQKTEAALRRLSSLEQQALSQARAARGDELQAGRQELSRAWDEARRQLSSLSQRMAADAYANPGLADSVKDAAAAAARASQDLDAAQQAAQKGDFSSAADRHARLARRADAARRLLEDGRKVQGLQDLFAQTGRMSQEASALQSALKGPAAAGKRVPAAQLAKLRQALERLKKQVDDLAAAFAKLPKADAASAPESGTVQLPLQQAKKTADALSRALSRGDYAAAARLAEQLADQLAQAQRGLEQAAAAAASSPRESREDAQLRQAQDQWSQLIEEQGRAMDQAQRLEGLRLAQTMQAQRDLLAELEKEQGRWVSLAAQKGDAFPQDALNAMRIVLAEFSARSIKRSVPLLAVISARLRFRSGPAQAALEPFAEGEDDIRRKLMAGAQAKAPPEPSRQAQQAQSAVRAETAGLQSRLEGMGLDWPAGTLESLSGAQGQQRGAEAALGQGDSLQGVARERSALELLERGSRQLSQMASRRQSLRGEMAAPFNRPGGGRPSGSGAGGRVGAQMTFVALPSAQEYRPAPEIRKELQKSLQEPRPASYEDVIREYFKRIAQ